MDNQFIDDVLCTALDSAYGGCWYWVTKTRIKEGTKQEYGVDCKYEVVSRGGTLIIYSEDYTRELTKDQFLHSVRWWANNNQIAEEDLDSADLDIIDADAILQYALFGEVVYD